MTERWCARAGKIQFDTKNDAQKKIDAMRRKRGAPKLTIYKCLMCDYFHMTSSHQKKTDKKNK